MLCVFVCCQDEGDPATSVEELEKQIEKLSKVKKRIMTEDTLSLSISQSVMCVFFCECSSRI